MPSAARNDVIGRRALVSILGRILPVRTHEGSGKAEIRRINDRSAGADIAVIQSPLSAPRNRSFVHHVAVERKDLAWDLVAIGRALVVRQGSRKPVSRESTFVERPLGASLLVGRGSDRE